MNFRRDAVYLIADLSMKIPTSTLNIELTQGFDPILFFRFENSSPSDMTQHSIKLSRTAESSNLMRQGLLLPTSHRPDSNSSYMSMITYHPTLKV